MLRSAGWLATASVVVLVAASAAHLPAKDPRSDQHVAAKRPLERGRPPSSSVPSLRIEGEVSGVPADGAGILTVRVGGVVKQQMAATSGTFALDLAGAPGAGMVSLEYTQPGIHFTSLLDSHARLVQLAGSDARLTREECECTRISAFSTGLHHAAEVALGHSPRTGVELGDAVRRVGPDLDLATLALARLAADPGLLPDSHETGLALLRDRPAFAAYLQETGFALFDDPATALADLPSAEMRDAHVPVRSALVGPVLDVQSPLATSASVLERAGNAFTLHSGVPGLGREYVGAIEDGRLVLLPQGDVSFVNPSAVMCPSTFQYTDEHRGLVRREIARQWGGSRLQIWRSYVEEEVSYPDCPELPTRVARSAGFSPVLDLADSRMLTSARRFSGSKALPSFCLPENAYPDTELRECAYAVHRFGGNGIGELLDLGDKVDATMQPIQGGGRAPFTWAMGEDGAMHVQVGATGTRYWVVDGGDGSAMGVVYVVDADRPGGNISMAGYTAMIGATYPDHYTPQTAAGAWGYGTFDFTSRPHVDRAPPRPVTIVRDADGRSVQFSGQSPTYVDRWTTAWGRLYSTNYSSPECVAPSIQCVPSAVRYFRPLARVGHRIHGIEEYYLNVGGTAPADGATLVWSRPQFHEARQMP
jgi:hypothetical protein